MMRKVMELIEENIRAEINTVENIYWFVTAAAKKDGKVVSFHKEVNSLAEALNELAEFTKGI